MSDVTIEVQRREQVGKGANRRLRRAEMIPAVVYGAGKESIAIQVPRKRMIDLFKDGGSGNRIFLLKLAGTDQSRHAMIRDLQVDPISRQVAHIDFQRIVMTEKIRVKVHFELVGTPVGVKMDGGILDFVTREVEIECLPSAIPHEIKVDVSQLHVGQHIEAKDVEIPPGVVMFGDRERVIAAVAHARAEEAATAAAVGEAAPATTEPEVIKKGKGEEVKES